MIQSTCPDKKYVIDETKEKERYDLISSCGDVIELFEVDVGQSRRVGLAHRSAADLEEDLFVEDEIVVAQRDLEQFHQVGVWSAIHWMFAERLTSRVERAVDSHVGVQRTHVTGDEEGVGWNPLIAHFSDEVVRVLDVRRMLDADRSDE